LTGLATDQNKFQENFMRMIVLALAALVVTACTTTEQRVGGAAAGAGIGAIAGPVGAVAGGAIGAVTGPTVTRGVRRAMR
jgi:osmotically inducible lipoprotein OsmB